jgi:hypothetical protein
VIVGIATVWIGWLAANPTRRLFYSMPTITPLLNSGHVQGIKVSHNEIVIKAPQVLEVVLTSQGRLDIASSAFDNNIPLQLDVNASILEILAQKSAPNSHGNPKVEIDGASLKIGPSLIGKRQRISYSLLVDGSEPTLSCASSPLIDVDLIKGMPTPTIATGRVRVPLMVAILLALTPIIFWTRRVLAGVAIAPVWVGFLEVIAGIGVAWSGASLVTWAVVTLLEKTQSVNSSSSRAKMRTAKVVVPILAAAGALVLVFSNPGFQPYIDTELDRYSINVPNNSDLDFKFDRFSPKLLPGAIRLINGKLISADMLLFGIGKSSPTFDNCSAYIGDQTHSVDVPPPHYSICAIGLHVTLALTISSSDKQGADLRVIVWEGNTSS